MRDFLNALEAVCVALILVVSVQGLLESAEQEARLEAPPWPPEDTRPTTADAK